MRIVKRGKKTVVEENGKELFSSKDDLIALRWAIDHAPSGVPVEIASELSLGKFAVIEGKRKKS